METAIAALQGERAAVVREGADLVFHLLVLLADAGATPADLRSISMQNRTPR